MKKIMSIVLVCVIVCTLFAGCINMPSRAASNADASYIKIPPKVNHNKPSTNNQEVDQKADSIIPSEPAEEVPEPSDDIETDGENEALAPNDDECQETDATEPAVEPEHECEYVCAERKEPTATEPGYVVMICTDCEHSYTSEIPVNYGCDPHDFVVVNIRAATDTTVGYMEMICKRCGYTYVSMILANSDSAMIGDRPIVLKPVNEKYNYEIVRTSWSESLMLSSGALNHSAIAKGERQLPMYRFDTLSDANDFATRFGFLSLGAYHELVASYDESFFETHSLILVYITAGSGTARFDISDIICDSGLFRVEVKQANDYEIGTCDMAGWFAVIEVDDDDLNECVKFEAGFASNTSGSELKKPIW